MRRTSLALALVALAIVCVEVTNARGHSDAAAQVTLNVPIDSGGLQLATAPASYLVPTSAIILDGAPLANRSDGADGALRVHALSLRSSIELNAAGAEPLRWSGCTVALPYLNDSSQTASADRTMMKPGDISRYHRRV